MYVIPEISMIKNWIGNVSPVIAVMMDTAAGTVVNVSHVTNLVDGTRRSMFMLLKPNFHYAECIRT